MANKPLMLLPLQNNLEGYTPNGTITATGSGALRYQDSGVLVEEGTTNHFINPLFDGVGSNEGSYWLKEPLGQGRLKFTKKPGASGDQTVYLVDSYGASISAATTVTASVWVEEAHTAAGTYRLWGGVRSSTHPTGSSEFWSSHVGEHDTPIRRTVTWDTVDTGVSAYLNIQLDGTWAEGDYIVVSRPQLEEKSYATSFCPSYTEGVLDVGYTWNGTPHASSSTREVVSVHASTEDVLDSVTGSMLFFLPQGSQPNDSYLFFVGNWGTNDALTVNSNSLITALFRSGEEPADYVSSTVSALDARVVYVAWTANTLELAVNDETLQIIPRTAPVGSTSATMGIGGVSWADAQINAPFGTFMTFGQPLTGSERDRVTALMMSGEVTWGSIQESYLELAHEIPEVLDRKHLSLRYYAKGTGRIRSELDAKTASSVFVPVSQEMVLGGEWEEVRLDAVADDAVVEVTGRIYPLDFGQDYLIDAIQLTSDALSPEQTYADGDDVDGQWDATPHQSISHRFIAHDTSYDVEFEYIDPDGVHGVATIGTTVVTPPQPDYFLTVKDMTITPGDTSLRVEVTYTGDDSDVATGYMEWKRNDSAVWQIIPFSWSRQVKRIYATIPNLVGGTVYNVRMTFSSGNSFVYGENPILRTAVTSVSASAPVLGARITFGGFALLDPQMTNVAVIEHDGFSAPQRDVHYEKLDRVDGEVEQHSTWRRREIKMEGVIYGNSSQELADTKSAFIRALAQPKQPLVIDTLDSRGFYATATVTDGPNFTERGAENTRHLYWEAEFTCGDPFRYSTSETVDTIDGVLSGSSFLVTNEGDLECDAVYTIKTANAIDPVIVTLSNVSNGTRLTPEVSLVDDDVLFIDTARRQVVKNGVEVDFSGGFPRLVRGSNQLTTLIIPNKNSLDVDCTTTVSVRRRHRFF